MYSIKDIIFSLILTVSIYSLPLWIYKLVTKKNISKKKAKWITIIYAIFAYILMKLILSAAGSFSSGSAIILWSFVNYKVLSKGSIDSSTANDYNSEENSLTDNSGYYDCFLSDENNIMQDAKAYLEFQNDGFVYLTNYIDSSDKLHTLSTPKKYSLEDAKNGITYKFKLTKDNKEKIYNLTIPGFDFYTQDEISDISYSDFLKYTLDNLPEQ